jgi:Zn-dependent protease
VSDPSAERPQPYNPVQERQSLRSKLAKAGGGVTAGGAITLKLFGKLSVLGKGLFLLVKLKTALSMLISVGVYSLFWGWRFALGFVLLIFVHELGHVFVLRTQGVKASAPMFIPLLGAFVKIEGQQRSVAQEAVSALAGPVVGMAGSWAVLYAAESTGWLLLKALAFTGFLLNLFNLFPVLPLDGGRVAGALHPAIWIGGMVAAVAFLIFHPSVVAVFILVMGGAETWRRWRERQAGKSGAYFSVEPATRWQIGLAYVGTAILCLVGMNMAYVAIPA